jgi:hypothetical protein
MDESIVTDKLSRGVSVAAAPSEREEYDLCLTLYALYGALPEWENCLVCSAETALEQAAMLVHRWHASSENGRANSLYSLLEVESLTYGEIPYKRCSTSTLIRPLLINR